MRLPAKRENIKTKLDSAVITAEINIETLQTVNNIETQTESKQLTSFFLNLALRLFMFQLVHAGRGWEQKGKTDS